jgi:ketosteroid isomerase-like protein
VTSNHARAAILARALRASVEGDRAIVPELYTDDVRAWAPARSVSSAAELSVEIGRRDDAFSDIELDVVPLDVGGDYACAEWTVSMTHSGRLTLPDGQVVEPTGARLSLHGATVAEFEGERICSLRQYWDDFAVLEQLGVVTRREESDDPT